MRRLIILFSDFWVENQLAAFTMSRGESLMAELIKGMHDLAIDLGQHNDYADKLLLKNNAMTEKLVVMKEVCF